MPIVHSGSLTRGQMTINGINFAGENQMLSCNNNGKIVEYSWIEKKIQQKGN